MKKVLFATTALIATAGIAAADGHTGISISGYAEMGVTGGDNAVTQFLQDVDVRFTLSGETDSGISFGASTDLDEDTANVNTDDNGSAVFISGDFGTLTLGDTDGGFDAGMQEVNIGSPGSIDDAETGHAGYTGNNGLDGVYDGQVLSYSYSISGFTITGSVEMDDGAQGIDTAAAGVLATSAVGPFGFLGLVNDDGLEGDAIYGIGASYAGSFGGGSYTVGAGYQATADYDAASVGDQELSIIGVSATVALDMGLSAGINYSQIDATGEAGILGAGTFVTTSGTHMAIGASYAFDDITVHANYGQFDWDANALVEDSTGFGFAAAYNLGGGLNAHLGYAVNQYGNQNAAVAATADTNTWSLGLSMAF